MPIFDRFASRPAGVEAGHVRVLGLAKFGSPSVLLRGNRGGQRRARVTRALIVLALLGLFCGSAVVTSERPHSPSVALRVEPTTVAQMHDRAHAEAWAALPAPGSANRNDFLPTGQYPGKTTVTKCEVVDVHVAGVLHGKIC
jgi:hypothetical protein